MDATIRAKKSGLTFASSYMGQARKSYARVNGAETVSIFWLMDNWMFASRQANQGPEATNAGKSVKCNRVEVSARCPSLLDCRETPPSSFLRTARRRYSRSTGRRCGYCGNFPNLVGRLKPRI